MYEDETMVENEDFDTEADDTLPEDVEEEQDESEESLESLDEGEEQTQEPADDTPPASEPGWIKKRVNKAVERAVAETERRMQAEFDRQMAPIREKMLNDEAKELVRQGEFKSLDRAKEYLQLKQGLPTSSQEEPQEQPRNDQEQDAGTSTRVDMLAHQAVRIKERTGIDVFDVFTNDEDIKQRVMDGEMDFYDIADMMSEQKAKRPPSPMRSPNGASGANQPNAITSMSDEQFDRMERRIREGARYSLK